MWKTALTTSEVSFFRNKRRFLQAKEEFDLSRKRNEEKTENAVVLLVTKGVHGLRPDLASQPVSSHAPKLSTKRLCGFKT
jgi:hypothetical protein